MARRKGQLPDIVVQLPQLGEPISISSDLPEAC
jgi:hypothetical protein